MKILTNEEQKERVRQRVNVRIDEEHYEYYPETEHTETYDNDAYQRVGIYVRVSTDDVHQTMSYELQKKYYEDFVVRHPKWKLVDIYADEGISGTSLKHRDNFNRMIADAKAGKLEILSSDLIQMNLSEPQQKPLEIRHFSGAALFFAGLFLAEKPSRAALDQPQSRGVFTL